MSIKILGDSTMDLSPELQKELSIPCVPFHINFGDVTKDDMSFPNEEMYAYFKKTGKLTQTSAVNVGEAKAFLEEHVKEGDEAYYLSISSDLSSGFQNVSLAAQELGDHIHVIDSRSFSLGIGLQALHLQVLVESGVTDKETLLKEIETYKDHVTASLTVEDLSFFAKGGRCSKLTAFGANLLKIRPTLMIKDGKFTVFAKMRGNMDKLGRKYAETVLPAFGDIDYSLALIGYTSDYSQGVKDLEQALKDAGFQRVVVTKTNSTNATHSGPNSYGFAFASGPELKKDSLFQRAKEKLASLRKKNKQSEKEGE